MLECPSIRIYRAFFSKIVPASFKYDHHYILDIPVDIMLNGVRLTVENIPHT